MTVDMTSLRDPLKLCSILWPEVRMYKEQRDVIYSVEQNDVTMVSAGNALGKDFVSGFVALWWFITRVPARVVTTSVKEAQLEDVLWGEIRRFVQTAKLKLPLSYSHLRIRRLMDDGSVNPNSELVGQVCNTAEAMLGRHSTAGFKPIQNDIPRTLVIFDEASGVDDDVFRSVQTWAHRILVIGNPWPCDNFFKKGVQGGDIPRDNGVGYHRKVFKIRAEDSPNVRYARSEIAGGRQPTDRVLVPGVKTWSKYCEQRKLWDAELQCVGLDAEFYEGPEQKLCPSTWLAASATRASEIAGLTGRRARGIGIDPAEGGDDTSMYAVDEMGVLEGVSYKTPDTNVIPAHVKAFALKHGILQDEAWRICIDRGGGGKQHADRLREEGWKVRTVAFGETLALVPKRAKRLFPERMDTLEQRWSYVNRRAQMYITLRNLIDPANVLRFAIPAHYQELRRQLSLMPLLYDNEGRYRMLPKDRKGENGDTKTLKELLGRSPDEADALVLACFAMTDKPIRSVAGAVV